jgi:hypothetical protein
VSVEPSDAAAAEKAFLDSPAGLVELRLKAQDESVRAFKVKIAEEAAESRAKAPKKTATPKAPKPPKTTKKPATPKPAKAPKKAKASGDAE